MKILFRSLLLIIFSLFLATCEKNFDRTALLTDINLKAYTIDYKLNPIDIDETYDFDSLQFSLELNIALVQSSFKLINSAYASKEQHTYNYHLVEKIKSINFYTINYFNEDYPAMSNISESIFISNKMTLDQFISAVNFGQENQYLFAHNSFKINSIPQPGVSELQIYVDIELENNIELKSPTLTLKIK